MRNAAVGFSAAAIIVLSSVVGLQNSNPVTAQAGEARVAAPWTKEEVIKAMVKGTRLTYEVTTVEGKNKKVEYEFRENTGYSNEKFTEDRWREDASGTVTQAKTSHDATWDQALSLSELGLSGKITITEGKKNIRFSGDEWNLRDIVQKFSGDEWSFKRYAATQAIAGVRAETAVEFASDKPGVILAYETRTPVGSVSLKLVDMRVGSAGNWCKCPATTDELRQWYKKGRTWKYEFRHGRETGFVCQRLDGTSAGTPPASHMFTTWRTDSNGKDIGDKLTHWEKWEDWGNLRAMGFKLADTSITDVTVKIGDKEVKAKQYQRSAKGDRIQTTHTAVFLLDDRGSLYSYLVRDDRTVQFSLQLNSVDP